VQLINRRSLHPQGAFPCQFQSPTETLRELFACWQESHLNLCSFLGKVNSMSFSVDIAMAKVRMRIGVIMDLGIVVKSLARVVVQGIFPD